MAKKPRKTTFQDPQAQREAKNYEHPIASREAILAWLDDLGYPAHRESMAEALGITDKRDHLAFQRRLKAMVRDGQLLKNRQGLYALVERCSLIKGRVIGHKEGYGFCVSEDEGDDVFLSAFEMRKVLHGDTVLVRSVGEDSRGRREGSIVDVLEHNTTSIVGRFVKQDDVALVIPDNKRITQDIVIPKGHYSKAKDNDIVVATILHQPSQQTGPIGKVMEVLGQHMAPGMEIDVAIRAHDLPHRWPRAVKQELKLYADRVLPREKEGRLDLRHLPLVTIDGEDAKDFDDAVYCERLKRGGYTLYVAIADVSHYVKAGSALDDEAYRRGNSVYFPKNVIPMLPEKLSNELCSLKPKVDRLCMVCEITLSAKGKIKKYKFHEAVMRSHARLTYNTVADLLSPDNNSVPRHLKNIYPHLQTLYDLFHVLQKQRQERGTIDFDMEETRIIFGRGRKIEQIVPIQRNDAHRIIEECMLCANICAARFISKNKSMALFRNHPRPEQEKLDKLKEFLVETGLKLKGGKRPKPANYAALLQQAEGRPDARLIQTVLLRSLSQAIYHPKNEGHFGLAFDEYTHFTSPIRRYPDLLLHRAIRRVLQKEKKQSPLLPGDDLLQVGQHCSMTERRADDATRDAVDWLKCEFMMDKVGEVFPGIITTVTSFGLFIMLKDIYVEGLLHISSLKNEYYRFDPIRHHLEGEQSGSTFRMGDMINVRVARVDLDKKEIDFELGNDKPANSKRKRKSQSKPNSNIKAKAKKKANSRREKRVKT
ncbi:MAG: ribonuclease R [Gammaproteobacteria bacterium]